VDRVKVGNTFRAIRVELRLRQIDVAARAGVSQTVISDLECGRFGGLSIDAFCRVAEVLDADVPLAPRWLGPKLDRILDRRHALIQNRVVELLLARGWVARTEFSFNQYGDRGSVDVLAWLPSERALLVIEIKTEITSLEETLRVLDMKRRVVPAIVHRELGWDTESAGTVLVMPDATAHRSLLDRHAALVTAALPQRTVTVRRWIAEPVGELRGIWFLRDTAQGGAKWRVLSSRRVRAAAPPTPSPSTSTDRAWMRPKPTLEPPISKSNPLPQPLPTHRPRPSAT
jgi:transcriptional regulator with XRE-family HTH domain